MLNFNRLPTSVQTCCSFPLLAVLDYILINMQHGLVLTKNQLPVLVKKKKIQGNTQEHVPTNKLTWKHCKQAGNTVL